MGCYSVGCALATLVRGIYFVFLLLLVMPAMSLPIDTTDDGKDISAAAAAAAAAAGSDEMPQADGTNKRSVNTFPLGSTYYMSTKNHYELYIDSDGKVKGIRPQPDSLRGALMTVQTLPCKYNRTHLSQAMIGAGKYKVAGSCNAVTISSQMGKDTLYICMNRKSGRVYTATSAEKTEECEFIEHPEHRYLQYHSHLQYKKLLSKPKRCRKALAKAALSLVPTPRQRRSKTKQRKNKKKKKDPCALWYLEIDKNGRVRKGRNAERSKAGAFFHKLDPNNTITVSPKTPPVIPGLSLDDKSKTDDPETRRPGGKGRGGKKDRHKKDRNRKDRNKKGEKRKEGGAAPFEVEGRRRHQGSRPRTSRTRGSDHGGLFSRNSGNPRSQLSGMALTSAESGEWKRTPS